jgi:uncharacterized protein (DUF362 family)
MPTRPPQWTRREWLAATGIAGAAVSVRKAVAAPTSTVAVARCNSYDAGILPAMQKIFDQIGGIGSLVSGKTVAVKIAMASPIRERTNFRPAWYTRWSHPAVIGAAVHLIGQAGARRIRILESSLEDDHPLEENILIGGWDPAELLKAAPNVEMENTGTLGHGKEYVRLEAAGGGLIYPAFDFNHSYKDCDVLVSIGKLKEHPNSGISLSIKNMLWALPGTIYSAAAGFEGPSDRPYGEYGILYRGYRQPPETSPAEKDPGSPRDSGYRVPRVLVDILRARPVDLAIVDGVETQTAAESTSVAANAGRKITLVKPAVLVAGRNPVCTDAVAAAVMGFDPMADRGKAPFEDCDNTLRLAEEAGIGTRDVGKIEVAGAAIREARFPFRNY